MEDERGNREEEAGKKRGGKKKTCGLASHLLSSFLPASSVHSLFYSFSFITPSSSSLFPFFSSSVHPSTLLRAVDSVYQFDYSCFILSAEFEFSIQKNDSMCFLTDLTASPLSPLQIHYFLKMFKMCFLFLSISSALGKL